MFNCKKCKSLEDEVRSLREINLKLVDRLTAISNPTAYGSVYLAENRSPPVQDEEEF